MKRTRTISTALACVNHECKNGASCYAVHNSQARYGCRCINGFSGQYCEIGKRNNACDDPSPCKNNGICVNTGIYGFKCICFDNFSGKTCENVDNNKIGARQAANCQANTCMNSGLCIPTQTSYVCSCLPAYTGTNCEIRK
jgi:hypothetical protein